MEQRDDAPIPARPRRSRSRPWPWRPVWAGPSSDFCNGFAGGWVLEAVLASTLIAFRGLHDRVRAVAAALDRDLEKARAAVAHIVGRDPARLDAPGVARAAAESLAENFSDGVVAPMFWFALLGLPGLCVYKAINTLDSMIGHRNPRFERFGKAAARLDDAVNWVPARLAGLLLVAAAGLLPEASARGRLAGRLARREPTPLAQRRLAGGGAGRRARVRTRGPARLSRRPGRRRLDGRCGRAELNAADLRASLRLYLVAGGLIAGLLAAAWLAL